MLGLGLGLKANIFALGLGLAARGLGLLASLTSLITTQSLQKRREHESIR